MMDSAQRKESLKYVNRRIFIIVLTNVLLLTLKFDTNNWAFLTGHVMFIVGSALMLPNIFKQFDIKEGPFVPEAVNYLAVERLGIYTQVSSLVFTYYAFGMSLFTEFRFDDFSLENVSRWYHRYCIARLLWDKFKQTVERECKLYYPLKKVEKTVAPKEMVDSIMELTKNIIQSEAKSEK
jgi:hypothetical protein